MDKNKTIILILLVVIAILAAGLVMSNMHSIEKKQTKLTILGNSSINEGDAIKVKLTDLNKTPIANQTVSITVTGKDNTSEYFSVVTNDKGVGKLDMNKSQGDYKINCTYGGNDNYTANSTAKKIKALIAFIISYTHQYSLDFHLNHNTFDKLPHHLPDRNKQYCPLCPCHIGRIF